MRISFEQKDLADLCQSNKSLFKRYPGVRGKKIAQRLGELRAAPHLEAMRHAPGRCEELRENLKGCFSIRIDANYRIIFRPDEPVPTKLDGGIDWQAVENIVIISLREDYH